MTKTAKLKHSYWRGQLNPLHPWFRAYLPQLCDKIVLELPEGVQKLTHWLLNPEQVPYAPIRIGAVEGRILAVNGTTRLAAALLLHKNWPVILEARNSSRHWDLVINAEPTRVQPILDAKSVPFIHRTLLMRQAQQRLLELDLDTTHAPLEQIQTLARALVPQSGAKKILTPS